MAAHQDAHFHSHLRLGEPEPRDDAPLKPVDARSETEEDEGAVVVSRRIRGFIADRPSSLCARKSLGTKSG